MSRCDSVLRVIVACTYSVLQLRKSYRASLQVSVMAIAVFACFVAGIAGATESQLHRPLALAGAVALRAALLLTPTTARVALELLNCVPATLSQAGVASLDGGSSYSGAAQKSKNPSVTAVVLSSDPLYACWAGSHKPAGALAATALFCVFLALPLATLVATLKHVYGGRRRLQVQAPDTMHSSEMRESPIVLSGSRARKSSVRDVCSPADTVNPGIIHPRSPPTIRKTAPGSAAPVVANTVPFSPLLAPFLSDYRIGAWYTRHVDLAYTLMLAALQALAPRPVTLSLVSGKAAAVGGCALALALHVLWVRPFAPSQAWKGPVRAALLVLTAACACAEAWAAAVDAGLSAPSASASAACAYAVLVLFGLALALLLAGVIRATLRGGDAGDASSSGDEGGSMPRHCGDADATPTAAASSPRQSQKDYARLQTASRGSLFAADDDVGEPGSTTLSFVNPLALARAPLQAPTQRDAASAVSVADIAGGSSRPLPTAQQVASLSGLASFRTIPVMVGHGPQAVAAARRSRRAPPAESEARPASFREIVGLPQQGSAGDCEL